MTSTAVRIRLHPASGSARLPGATVVLLAALGVGGAALSAVLHVPAWATEPVFSSINTAVVAVMLPLGAYLFLRRNERFTGLAFAATGLTWLTNSFDIYPGWGPYLTWVLAGLPYVTIAWGILRYRRDRLETRAERLLVPTAFLLTSGISVAVAPFLPPEVLGFAAGSRWPAVTPLSSGMQAAVLAAMLVAVDALAVYFCVVVRQWLLRAPRLVRPSLRPMALCGAGLAVCGALVQTVAVVLPELISSGRTGPLPSAHLAFALVGILFLGITGGLIASLTTEELLGSRLLVRLPAVRTPQTVAAYVREILQDPSAELLFWSAEHRALIDVDGHRRLVPGTDDRFVEWIVDGRGERIALLTAADDVVDPALLESLARILTIVCENAQLAALLRMRLAELTATRIAEQLAFSRAQEEFHRNLHDGVQQTIAAVRMDVDGLHDVVDTTTAHDAVSAVDAKLTLALDQIRGLKKGATPPELRFGLKPAVERVVAELRLPATAHVTDADLGILTLPVYYIVRESLTNVHKHAGAGSVEVTVATDGARVDITVTDDGRGGVRESPQGGIGGMRRRTAELGGVLEIVSPAGGGTTLVASVPHVPE